jgi:hypothetical protein
MSKLTLFAIEEQIKKHEQGLKDLQAQLVEAKLESPDHQLAKELHGMLCNQNHTDGCGWYYEVHSKIDDWTGSNHTEYLKKAQKMICHCDKEGMDITATLAAFKLIRGY